MKTVYLTTEEFLRKCEESRMRIKMKERFVFIKQRMMRGATLT